MRSQALALCTNVKLGVEPLPGSSLGSKRTIPDCAYFHAGKDANEFYGWYLNGEGATH